jgi:hypothetical protein
VAAGTCKRAAGSAGDTLRPGERIDLAEELIPRDHDGIAPGKRQQYGLLPWIAGRIQENVSHIASAVGGSVAAALRAIIAGNCDRYSSPTARRSSHQ